jgi:FMN phosphatase YigB (HAD superfamily)
MAKSGVRAIIFDIGRVLVGLDLSRAHKSLANGLTLSSEELWTAIEKDPQWGDWQEGRVTSRDWHLRLCKRFGIKPSFEDFVNAWNSVLDPKPLQPDSFFVALSKNYRLGLLSNTDPIHVDFLERTYSFYNYFPRQVRTYSCSAHARKPDPLIFREALKACKVSAEQTVYVDDIAAFAQAARSLGVHGIHYISPEQLRTELHALGIAAPELPQPGKDCQN